MPSDMIKRGVISWVISPPHHRTAKQFRLIESPAVLLLLELIYPKRIHGGEKVRVTIPRHDGTWRIKQPLKDARPKRVIIDLIACMNFDNMRPHCGVVGVVGTHMAFKCGVTRMAHADFLPDSMLVTFSFSFAGWMAKNFAAAALVTISR